MRATTEADHKKGFLPHKEVLTLARAWRDHRDENARTRIILAFRRLAVTAAAKARRSGIPVSDLVQEANIGLMSALERFDPELGFSFATLAQYHVRSRIQMYILANIGPVRIFNTGETKTLLGRYAALRQKHEVQGRLSPEARLLICRDLGIKESELDRYEQAIAIPVSLDAGAGEAHGDDDSGTRSLMLRSDDESPEEAALNEKAQDEARSAITGILNDLSERERIIITERFFNEDEHVTLEMLSVRLNISRERVRQIELKTLQKIGNELRARGIETVQDLF